MATESNVCYLHIAPIMWLLWATLEQQLLLVFDATITTYMLLLSLYSIFLHFERASLNTIYWHFVKHLQNKALIP